MIEYAMLLALGFLIASILAVLFAGPFWRRAVRLTRKRMEATMPMSIADIQADKDLLRAEYAVELRRMEMAHDREKENAARFLVERNKHKVGISELKAKLKTLAASLEERSNESTVLEQTVRKRIPDLERQLERARQIIAGRDRELARTATAYNNQTEALGIAKKAAQHFSQEIERLRAILDSGGAGDDDTVAAENGRLQAQISRLRQEVERHDVFEAEENAALRREIQNLSLQIMQGVPPATIQPASEDEIAQEDTDEAELNDADADAKKKSRPRNGPPGDDGRTSGTSLGDRLKKLTARAGA